MKKFLFILLFFPFSAFAVDTYLLPYPDYTQCQQDTDCTLVSVRCGEWLAASKQKAESLVQYMNGIPECPPLPAMQKPKNVGCHQGNCEIKPEQECLKYVEKEKTFCCVITCVVEKDGFCKQQSETRPDNCKLK